MDIEGSAIPVSVLGAFLSLWLTLAGGAPQPVDITQLKAEAGRVHQAKELADRSALIIYGRIGGEIKAYPTGRKLDGGELVHYIQPVYPLHMLKGKPRASYKLFWPGIEPLPNPQEPLNEQYPGPLESGVYVLFLRPVEGSSYYSTVGVWQGIYPVHEGRTISLKGTGFPILDNLTIPELERTIRSLQHPEHDNREP